MRADITAKAEQELVHSCLYWRSGSFALVITSTASFFSLELLAWGFFPYLRLKKKTYKLLIISGTQRKRASCTHRCCNTTKGASLFSLLLEQAVYI